MFGFASLLNNSKNAYLSFLTPPEIEEYNAYFEVSGSITHRIFGPGIYKIDAGEHEIVITTEAGGRWSVNAEVGYNKMLTIKLEVSGSDISDVLYRVEDPPMGVNMFSMKL